MKSCPNLTVDSQYALLLVDERTGGNSAASRKERGLGDQVEDIYHACYQDLMRYLLLTGCSGADATDFLQEAFLRMARSMREGKRVESPKHWLLSVVRNLRCREHRRTARFVDVGDDGIETILNRDSAAKSDDPESALLNNERYERVRQELSRLTPRECQCILLRVSGLKLREIADLFGISVGTVAETCGRAIGKLRRLKNE